MQKRINELEAELVETKLLARIEELEAELAQNAINAEFFGSVHGLKNAAKELLENFYEMTPEQRQALFAVAAYMLRAPEPETGVDRSQSAGAPDPDWSSLN